jgi:hypothetical protein
MPRLVFIVVVGQHHPLGGAKEKTREKLSQLVAVTTDRTSIIRRKNKTRVIKS